MQLIRVGVGLLAAIVSGHSAWAAVPQRIASLNLCTDQILLQLVPKQRIVGLSRMSQIPANSPLFERAKGLPSLSGNAEEVLALQPDLVLVGTQTTRHTAALLRDFGIPVLAIAGANSLSDVREQIRTVALAVGEPNQGAQVIATLDVQAQNIQRGLDRSGDVAVPYWAGGRSAGQGTLHDDILLVAGYVNGASKAGLKGYGSLALERVVEQRPQLLVSNDYKRGEPTLGNRVLKHPALQGIGARELQLPSRQTSCGGLWNLDAAAWLALQGAKP